MRLVVSARELDQPEPPKRLMKEGDEIASDIG